MRLLCVCRRFCKRVPPANEASSWHDDLLYTIANNYSQCTFALLLYISASIIMVYVILAAVVYLQEC